jgi:hypothetical protein
MFCFKIHLEKKREVWLQLAISAIFSSLEIKGNEEVDLTIGLMDPVAAGAGARNRPLTNLTFLWDVPSTIPCSSVDSSSSSSFFSSFFFF